jgi:hypothetical protein
MSGIHLLPRPRQITQHAGVCQANVVPRIESDPSLPNSQAYRLIIQPDQIRIMAREKVGEFYAHQTLAQLQSLFPKTLPCLEITDWPDFPVRGVMLDISRDKVPTLSTLFSLIDLLASWKINQLQLYTEHTFAYSAHRMVWEHASPITADEIRQLDAYCKAKFIDLVPNQNSFGHMERWLKHPNYRHLAEVLDGAQTPWGFRWKGPFSLCPTDPQSLKFLAGLYDELLPNFTSQFFNVGCDETFDIGQGKSKEACDRIGVHRVYLEFIRQVNDLVKRHDRQMMFWGDVILHQPELIGELPREVIALQWGYEANHPFDKEGEAFARAGIPYYVCPGTSGWNSIAGRTDNAIANLKSAARSGLTHGAIGYLITDWGDNGHLQYLPISYQGFAAGAAYSWCLPSNEALDLPAALNHHAFKNRSANLGQIAFDLGNVYRVCGKHNANGSALFRLLVLPPNDPSPENGLTQSGLADTEQELGRIAGQLSTDVPGDADCTVDEFRSAIDLLRLCVAIGRKRLGYQPANRPDFPKIIAEHRRLWLVRNRPGGLDDSIARINPDAQCL